ARRERVAAGDAARSVDRVAKPSQALDVATQGPRRHLESLRELGTAPRRTRLEQRQESKEAARRLEHATKLGTHRGPNLSSIDASVLLARSRTDRLGYASRPLSTTKEISMKFASIRLIAADIKAMVAFYEWVTRTEATWLAPVFAEIVMPG